jgi:hypothetical protein
VSKFLRYSYFFKLKKKKKKKKKKKINCKDLGVEQDLTKFAKIHVFYIYIYKQGYFEKKKLMKFAKIHMPEFLKFYTYIYIKKLKNKNKNKSILKILI